MTGADLMIAATALEHGLCRCDRTFAIFIPKGWQVLNPFSQNPRQRSTWPPR